MDYEFSEEIDQIAAALCQAQRCELFAATDKNNPFFKSKYADLSSCWAAARKPLTDAGLSVCQYPEPSEKQGELVLVTLLMHASGQWIRGKLTMPLVKLDPQAVGSAYTYARRYTLAGMIGLCPQDDDAEQAVIHADEKPAARNTKKTAKQGRSDAEKLAKANEKFLQWKETDPEDWRWCCSNAGLMVGDADAGGYRQIEPERLNSLDEAERFWTEWKTIKEKV